jgi:hypothetical protein
MFLQNIGTYVPDYMIVTLCKADFRYVPLKLAATTL